MIPLIFQESPSTLNNNDSEKPNELVENKSEKSYYVQPNTQVSTEPLSSKIENISDDDEDLLHSSTTNESSFDTVLERKQEEINDDSFKIEDNVQSNQNDDNRIIVDMHDVANRLTSLHDQLNQYVYLTENLNELRANVEQIKTLHSGVEKEKTTIDNLVERANNINPQLATLSQDLEEKRIEDIADQFKLMSSTIDEYKTIGLTLINTAQRYINTEPIQNEIASIDKSWSEYVEYILDTIDYIQLHQEDLREFQQLSNDLIDTLNDKQIQIQTINDNELKTFNDDLEKYYEQVELLNQKGELLLQSSAVNLNDDNENKVERLLETINRNYDCLTVYTKARIEDINNIQQSTTQETTTTTTTTTTEEQQISPEITNKLTDEIRHHIDETVLAMNELSELLVTSTSDIISAQPIKLSEQLLDNAAVESELEQRKIALEQLRSNIETLEQMITNPEDVDSIKALDEKFTELNDHWSIMKQANDIRTENLLLTQTCGNTFWSQYNELSTFLNNIDKQLLQIRPRSTSRVHI
ncbi:unnamed protein product [Rotaria sp. Silwood2]|nr:unnamed protein product [Rotaria sp. Silwood2]